MHFPDTVLTAEDLPNHLLRTEMIMHTTAVRNWSYDHKLKKNTLDIAKKITYNFIDHHGFDPVDFLELLYEITEIAMISKLPTK